jgi:hypothetical protein
LNQGTWVLKMGDYSETDSVSEWSPHFGRFQ